MNDITWQKKLAKKNCSFAPDYISSVLIHIKNINQIFHTKEKCDLDLFDANDP